jgi:hypothetical protein
MYECDFAAPSQVVGSPPTGCEASGRPPSPKLPGEPLLDEPLLLPLPLPLLLPEPELDPPLDPPELPPSGVSVNP